MKTFDEAGRELADQYLDHNRYTEKDVTHAFLTGRDSCKEALRVAWEALNWCAEAQDFAGSRYRADMAKKLIEAAGCFVGEE